MALLEISIEQILDLIQQLPLESQRSIVERLNQQLVEKLPDSEMDEESRL